MSGAKLLPDTWNSCDRALCCEEESKRLSFPGFPLGNLNTALAFESRKLGAAQSTIWLVLQGLVRGAEPPAARSCLLQPPSVCASCQLCSVLPTRAFRAQSVLLGVEHWKGQSGLPRPLCCNCKRLWRFFLCRWLLCRGRLARIIQQDLLVNTTRPVLCCHSLTPQRFPGFHLQFQCEHAEQHIGLQGCA